MPKVKISPKCTDCLESTDFHNRMCPSVCPEGKKIEKIFELCYGSDPHGDLCRHIDDCKQDPRTCGYWTDQTYPIEVD
jgi:hypothetical protein